MTEKLSEWVSIMKRFTIKKFGKFLLKMVIFFTSIPVLSQRNAVEIYNKHDYNEYFLVVYRVYYDSEYYFFSKIYESDTKLDTGCDLDLDNIKEYVKKSKSVLSVMSEDGDYTNTFRQFIEYYNPTLKKFQYIERIKEYINHTDKTLFMVTDDLKISSL